MNRKQDDGVLALEVRRLIPASPSKVFDAWTDPDKLMKWWGPKDIICVFAEIDLQVGGRYRIGNQLPDQSTIVIEGVFEEIERPEKLVYSWQTDVNPDSVEQVTVQFCPIGADDTEVIIRHERIRSTDIHDQHQKGWNECLSGLVKVLAS